MRNTYARYHICLMRVFILLLSIRYNVCVYHNPVYHYITATAVYLTCILVSPKYHYIIVTVVYLVYCIIAVCVVVL